MDSKDFAQKCKDPKQSSIQELVYKEGARWIWSFGEQLAAQTQKEHRNACEEVFLGRSGHFGWGCYGDFPLTDMSNHSAALTKDGFKGEWYVFRLAILRDRRL